LAHQACGIRQDCAAIYVVVFRIDVVLGVYMLAGWLLAA